MGRLLDALDLLSSTGVTEGATTFTGLLGPILFEKLLPFVGRECVGTGGGGGIPSEAAYFTIASRR